MSIMSKLKIYLTSYDNYIYYFRLLKFYIKLPYIMLMVFLDKGIAISQNSILIDINYHEKINNRLVIFSHFDRDNKIDDYVLYYLIALKKLGSDIVFVSTAETINPLELQKLSSLCKRVVVKRNIGYDFGSWKSGIELELDNLKEYTQLILCNDSVYAPLFDLNSMFNHMQDKYDFWGITDNYQYSHHIQSYFMVFSQSLFLQPFFLAFWKTIRVFERKQSIIINYEIGLTKLMRYHHISYAAYCPATTKELKNTTHKKWKHLIVTQNSPIVKIELLRDNPDNADIDGWEQFLADNTLYDISLIQNHLKRIKQST